MTINEKLDIFKDEYLPMIIDLYFENIPSFEEYLSRRCSPIVGKMIFKNNNWYLI